MEPTLPVFPLDRVWTRFQIMGKIPGYRNHFFRQVCPFPVLFIRVDVETGREEAAINAINEP
jgi:hypothetical protein